jgi:glycosyltransferase involved in cell wall biosynthesis
VPDPTTRPSAAPLRVLHLAAGRDWRGGERQLLLLAEGQRAMGLEPLVAAGRASALLRRARHAGLAGAAVTMRGTWDVAAARRLRRLLRTWRPDVVHAHDARAHAVALIALVGSDVPLVVTRRTAGAVPVGARLRYGARVTRFLVPTAAARMAVLRAGVAPARVDVVPPGVPRPDESARRDWRGERAWPDDALVVGMLGLTGERGTALAAAVAAALVARLGSEAPRLRLVRFGGPGADAQTVAGVPCVRAGLVDDLGAALAGLDLLLHVPTHDLVGMASLEALALGVPVVAVPTGGLEELVRDGEGALLVRPAPGASWPEALAAAAAPLLTAPERRSALGAAARRGMAALPPERFVAASTAAYAVAGRVVARRG